MRRSRPWPRAILAGTRCRPSTTLPRRHGWRRPDRGSPGQAAGLSHDHPGRRPGHRHRRSQPALGTGRHAPGAAPFRARAELLRGRPQGSRAAACRSTGRCRSCPASATTAAPCRRSAPASGSMAACPTTPSWPAWPASRSPDRSLPPADTRYRHVLDPQHRTARLRHPVLAALRVALQLSRRIAAMARIIAGQAEAAGLKWNCPTSARTPDRCCTPPTAPTATTVPAS